jgi:hypothetical protein
MCKTVDVHVHVYLCASPHRSGSARVAHRLGFAATTVLASKTISVVVLGGAEWPYAHRYPRYLGARQTEGSPVRGGDQRLTRSGALIATVVGNLCPR